MVALHWNYEGPGSHVALSSPRHYFHLCDPTSITPMSQSQPDRRGEKGEGMSLPFKSKFVSILTIGILGQIFVVGGCPVHWRKFSSIPRLYPMDASNIPLPSSCDNQKWPQTCQISPGVGRYFTSAHILWLELRHVITHNYKEDWEVVHFFSFFLGGFLPQEWDH